MNKQNSAQALQNQIDNLPSEMSPERDLWQGIERAISVQELSSNQRNSNTQKKQTTVYAWAASIVAAVLLTWFNVGPQNSVHSNDVTLVASMTDNFTKQKQLLLTSFGQPDLEKLSPDMQEQLANLANARASIEKALIGDEDNADLLNLLQWTQQQELDLLQKLYSPQWQTI